jgi:hypothetical protein
MENPDFVMIDKKFNNPEFINYLKELVRE